MSNSHLSDLKDHAVDQNHAHAHDHDEHEESFVSKYIFSMDHKMIARQFLLTAVVMAVIAMMMSVIGSERYASVTV
jgi:cytochrome c oxidase subunit 1